jgi:NAD(P)-dependent dehydrogenase (short-subunit alcohol dehydrogenase family)
MTKSTAFMYAPDRIRCNVVAPGPVATRIDSRFCSRRRAARLQPHLAFIPPIA